MSITHETHWYVDQESGLLDMDKLLAAFQDFFRKYSESWEERFRYKEAGPQLLMQAFLQRVLNAGGRIHREYGLDRKRTDLLVVWPYQDGVQEVVIELKFSTEIERRPSNKESSRPGNIWIRAVLNTAI